MSLAIRMRRLRKSQTLRELLTECALRPDDLMYPLFVLPGKDRRFELDGLPGIRGVSADLLAGEAERLLARGIRAVLLFPVPEGKDDEGRGACDPHGLIPEAARRIKNAGVETVVFADLCLCAFTDHGHCGVIRGGKVDNDATLEVIRRSALVMAEAGVDGVAPSCMMDGVVRSVREELEENGFEDVLIMAYAAKFASGLYNPFRAMAHSSPAFGDRRDYQVNPANAREALREMGLDAEEGADILMVKPALPCLDILARARHASLFPLAAYNVSGEYAMVKAASRMGWLDERAVTLELLSAMKRAGADIIVSYHAEEVAGWLLEGQ